MNVCLRAFCTTTCMSSTVDEKVIIIERTTRKHNTSWQLNGEKLRDYPPRHNRKLNSRCLFLCVAALCVERRKMARQRRVQAHLIHSAKCNFRTTARLITDFGQKASTGERQKREAQKSSGKWSYRVCREERVRDENRKSRGFCRFLTKTQTKRLIAFSYPLACRKASLEKAYAITFREKHTNIQFGPDTYTV